LTSAAGRDLSGEMDNSLRVNLGERSYDIQLGSGLAAKVGLQLAALKTAGRKAAVVTDANFAEHQPRALAEIAAGAPVLVIIARNLLICCGVCF